MATAKSTNRKTSTKGRRTGRPTNAERAARVQSEAVQLINLRAASYAAGMADALGIDPSAVSTVASVPQGSQSASASIATSAQPAQTSARKSARKAPGRKVNPDSNASKTRAFYAENMKLPADQRLDRAAFVKAVAKKFGCTPQTANTYVSNIERIGGHKLNRRGTGAARGRSRGGNGNGGQKTGTAG